jgi:SPOR domain
MIACNSATFWGGLVFVNWPIYSRNERTFCVPKNDDGEFELVLGNNQLLSVFFLVVLLLALCFIGGYTVGRNGAPTLAATTVPTVKQKPDESKVLVAKEESKPEPEEQVVAPPVKQREVAPERVKPELRVEAKVEAKATPPPPEKQPPVTSQPPLSSQPMTGRIYLQLSATDKDKAETMVDLIRSKNIPAIAASIADRPNLYRVLVGPLTDSTIADTREQLKANGFPADQAIRRVF